MLTRTQFLEEINRTPALRDRFMFYTSLACADGSANVAHALKLVPVAVDGECDYTLVLQSLSSGLPEPDVENTLCRLEVFAHRRAESLARRLAWE